MQVKSIGAQRRFLVDSGHISVEKNYIFFRPICVPNQPKNAPGPYGQKYCRMLQGEHSAILLTFIKLPFVIKIFVLSIFEWPFYTGFTVLLFFSQFSCMVSSVAWFYQLCGFNYM